MREVLLVEGRATLRLLDDGRETLRLLEPEEREAEERLDELRLLLPELRAVLRDPPLPEDRAVLPPEERLSEERRWAEASSTR